MPAALHGMSRPLVVLAIASLLGACRVGGGEALAPTENPADPSEDDAGKPGQPDAGPVSPAPADGGSAPMLDAAPPSDGGGAMDGSLPPQDAGCVDECKPVITVPTGCTRADRLDRIYLFCSDAVRWNDARSRCLSAGADLVVIEDEAENAFVAANVGGVSWIGANDLTTERTFVWIAPGKPGESSSSPLTFERWAPATPDNCLGGVIGQQDCVRIAADGSWNDSDCEGGCTEGPFAFVCESY